MREPMLDVGVICRSREPILKTLPEDDARLCRVSAVLPPSRWRNPAIPEYKVELLAAPVTAFLSEDHLVRVR